ncbi:MAG: hypothetical protein QM756_29125 [Polyangiaceae bacterium]
MPPSKWQVSQVKRLERPSLLALGAISEVNANASPRRRLGAGSGNADAGLLTLGGAANDHAPPSVTHASSNGLAATGRPWNSIKSLTPGTNAAGSKCASVPCASNSKRPKRSVPALLTHNDSPLAAALRSSSAFGTSSPSSDTLRAHTRSACAPRMRNK